MANKKKKKRTQWNWPEIPDYPTRLTISGCNGSRRTNALLNLINHQQGIDKIC